MSLLKAEKSLKKFLTRHTFDTEYIPKPLTYLISFWLHSELYRSTTKSFTLNRFYKSHPNYFLKSTPRFFLRNSKQLNAIAFPKTIFEIAGA